MTTSFSEEVSQPASFAAIRFTTADLPPRDRIAIWRDVIGRKLLRVDIEPWSDRLFHIDATVRTLPGAGVVRAAISEFRLARTRELLSDGNDGLRLAINTAEPPHGQDFMKGHTAVRRFVCRVNVPVCHLQCGRIAARSFLYIKG